MTTLVFGINCTENKKNETVDGVRFITETATPEEKKALEASSDQMLESLQTAKPPLLLRLLPKLFAFCGLIAVTVFLRSLTLEDPQNTLGFYIPFLVVGILLFLLSLVTAKLVQRHVGKKLESDETKQVINHLDHVSAQINQNLGIPDTAREMDILLYRYTVKKEKQRPFVPGLALTPYINTEMYAYVQGDALCLADAERVFSFPLDEIRGIQTVKKRICVPFWNKETPYNKEEFNPYGMTANQYGCIFFKPYHLLQLAHEGELWEIAFPCYELPLIEALTGHRAAGEG